MDSEPDNEPRRPRSKRRGPPSDREDTWLARVGSSWFGGARRFLPVIFVLCGVLALLLGFAVPKKTITEWFHASGFYMIFASVVLWLTLLPRPTLSRSSVVTFLREHGAGAALALAFTTGAFLTCPPAFRILADETNLLGTAMDMYDSHSFRNPTEAIYYFEGVRDLLSSEWDKRPLFYPFMVYLVHTALGYDAEQNGFIVNFICSVGLFFSFYYYQRSWFSRFHSLVGMSLLAAIPLVVMWSTSSGFEIPNLFFAVLAFIAFDRLLVKRTGQAATYLMATVLLLSQIRYESALFALCLLPWMPFLVKRAEYKNIGVRSLLIPFLFLPVVWQRRISFGQGVFQMKDNKPPFAVEYLFGAGAKKGNLDHAYDFFTAAQPQYGTIPIIFWVAVVGFFGSVIWLTQRRRDIPLRLWAHVGAAVAIVFSHAAILFFYFCGNLTLQYALRLGIIFLPFMVVLVVCILHTTAKSIGALAVYVQGGAVALVLCATVYLAPLVWGSARAVPLREHAQALAGIMVWPFIVVLGVVALHYSRKNAERVRYYVAVAVVALFAFYWPVAGANAAVKQIFIFREFRLVKRFVEKEYPDKDVLMVTDLSNLYVPFRFSAIRIGRANSQPEFILRKVDRKLKTELIAVQRIQYKDGEPQAQTKLDADKYQLETLYETQYNGGHKLRISRVTPADGFEINKRKKRPGLQLGPRRMLRKR